MSENVAADPAAPTQRSAMRGVLLLLLAAFFGMAGGAAAAVYLLRVTPVPPAVVVIDTDAMLREAIRLDPQNPKGAADRVVAQMQARVAQLVAQGIVVLDRNAVFAAPPTFYVRTDVSETEPPKAGPTGQSGALGAVRP